jgi:acetyltransferase-like isoleucine patch superfamily enzyme
MLELEPEAAPPTDAASPERTRVELLEAVRLITNARLRLRRCDAVGPRTRLRGRVCVRNDGSIAIGDQVVLLSDCVPIELQTMSGGAITIGDRTLINYGSIIVAYERVTVGSRCLIGKHVIVMDNNQHDIIDRDLRGPSRPVQIGDRAWLGDRSIVLPGVSIGEGAVIGAGAVVTRDVPAWSVAVGNPARLVRSLV